MLSNIETHKEKVLRIILAGQPELRDTLASPKLKQLVQRVRLRFHVGSLDKITERLVTVREELARNELTELVDKLDQCRDALMRGELDEFRRLRETPWRA